MVFHQLTSSINVSLIRERSHYLLSLHPLCMSNLLPSATLFPPPCGWIHFNEPRWTKEPGPFRLVVPGDKRYLHKISTFTLWLSMIAKNVRHSWHGKASALCLANKRKVSGLSLWELCLSYSDVCICAVQSFLVQLKGVHKSKQKKIYMDNDSLHR